jgi:hypothetical protein
MKDLTNEQTVKIMYYVSYIAMIAAIIGLILESRK